MRLVRLERACLHHRVAAEQTERADEIAAQLARELVLAGACPPAEALEGGRETIAHECLEARPIAGLDEPVERIQRAGEDGPHVAVPLTAKARGEVQIRG